MESDFEITYLIDLASSKYLHRNEKVQNSCLKIAEKPL